MQKRYENRWIRRRFLTIKRAENPTSPVQHVASVAAGAAEKIRIFTCSVTKRAGDGIEHRDRESLSRNCGGSERDRDFGRHFAIRPDIGQETIARTYNYRT